MPAAGAEISAAIRRGLIEARCSRRAARRLRRLISAAIRRGLIEAIHADGREAGGGGFPRPFAAASLKPTRGGTRVSGRGLISAAIRRGLIEAAARMVSLPTRPPISAAIRRGLIEARKRPAAPAGAVQDFRGHSPRPH